MATVHALAARWNAAWQALAADPPAGERERLLAAWSEPQRHYHTLQHLAECLEGLDRLQHHATHPAEVAVGLWYHDAVYDPRRHDNEALSARWAQRSLHAAGVDPVVAGRVAALVLATRHEAQPQGRDQEVLIDLDLAILGAEPARFDQYERQIRAEYAWVEEEEFRRARRAVLESFRDRPQLFCTIEYRTALEARARHNIARALARL